MKHRLPLDDGPGLDVGAIVLQQTDDVAPQLGPHEHEGPSPTQMIRPFASAPSSSACSAAATSSTSMASMRRVSMAEASLGSR